MVTSGNRAQTGGNQGEGGVWDDEYLSRGFSVCLILLVLGLLDSSMDVF